MVKINLKQSLSDYLENFLHHLDVHTDAGPISVRAKVQAHFSQKDSTNSPKLEIFSSFLIFLVFFTNLQIRIKDISI